MSAYYDLIARKDNLKHWIDSLDYNTFGRVEQLLSIAGIYNEESASSTAVSDMNKNIEKAVKPLQRLMIPVVGRSAAGLPIEMIEVPEDPVYINGETRIQPGDFAVIAAGDSMIGVGISDGNKCIIRPQNCVENGQIALVAVGDNSTIKRFFMDEDGFRLVPCNPDSAVQNYPPDASIRVLGRLISVVK
ncbi:MAG: S24 family peptidase [Clostridia bacterium]|nr:S24 family peptidase [Clostridia bacterium]